MSKRLQVVLAEDELRRYEALAKSLGMTLSEWARQALRTAQRERSVSDVESRLKAIRRAGEHSFPTADIEVMLAEIDQGRSTAGTL